MTRHSWPAAAIAVPEGIAGAVALLTSAATAVAVTAVASRRVRRLRICCPFSPIVGRFRAVSAEAGNVSGTVTRPKCQSQAVSAISAPSHGGVDYRNVPEHASIEDMTELARAQRPSRVTIREVADLAGVSIATVSRVLNGRGDVSDETRDLVTRVVRENGYTANRNARGLSAGRTGLVGVLVPLLYPAYFSAIMAGAAEALSERDLQIVLSPTGHEHDRKST